MKIPRDLSGEEFAKALQRLGYFPARPPKGSHVRLTTQQKGEHHVTIPLHKSLKLGTLSGILGEVARHFEMSRDELLNRLF